MGAARRVSVIGVTGSGKTTFSGVLAARLDVSHVEMDALHWDPDWTMAPLDVFRARVAEAVAGEGWVMDGSYSKVRDLVWPRTELVVWLDYPLALVLSRLIRRTARRLWTGEELYNGNRERLRDHLSRDSLVLYAFGQHRRTRRVVPAQLAAPENAHLSLVRFGWPGEAERWLAALPTRPPVHF